VSDSIRDLGWSASDQSEFEPLAREGLSPARVVAEHRGLFRLLDQAGPGLGELAGRLRHEALERHELPVVGDWVAVPERSPDERARILRVLPRRTLLARKEAGEPVVVLTKADLCAEPGEAVARAAAVASGAPVHAVSAVAGSGLAELEERLAPGRTLVLLGSSGVGKSTLLNRLLGRALMATGAIREADDRGRHSTTHRQLVRLPGGALLIDTPGLREVGLAAGEGVVSSLFEDVESLTEACRFRDCRHSGEPGCAVLEAVEGGRLDEGRLLSWRQLEREAAHERRRLDLRARREEKRRWKAISKASRRQRTGR
jgi:ribosome biogenesis GTPase